MVRPLAYNVATAERPRTLHARRPPAVALSRAGERHPEARPP
jgi:hypothetical protein